MENNGLGLHPAAISSGWQTKTISADADSPARQTTRDSNGDGDGDRGGAAGFLRLYEFLWHI